MTSSALQGGVVDFRIDGSSRCGATRPLDRRGSRTERGRSGGNARWPGCVLESPANPACAPGVCQAQTDAAGQGQAPRGQEAGEQGAAHRHAYESRDEQATGCPGQALQSRNPLRGPLGHSGFCPAAKRHQVGCGAELSWRRLCATRPWLLAWRWMRYVRTTPARPAIGAGRSTNVTNMPTSAHGADTRRTPMPMLR